LGMKGYAAAAEHAAAFAAAGALLRWVPWEAGGRALPVLGGWAGERRPPELSPRPFRSLWKDGIR
jgi:hypothetical protein